LEDLPLSEVEEKFATIIVAQFGVDSASITPATRFLEDLQADSLAVVELIITVEEAFDIEIPDDVAAGHAERRRFYAVLHLDGIRSPLDAVRAAIVSKTKPAGHSRR
jgi:acyl carrier protein